VRPTRAASFLAVPAVLVLQASCLAWPPGPARTARDVTTPEQHLGHELGLDNVLPDWEAVSGYFRLLGEESPRVRTEVVGRTTEGRDFLLAIISSERNLARLDEIREQARLLADPRGASAEQLARAVEDAPVVLFVSCAMHATECAAPQFALRLAHDLATSDDEPWRSAREEVVLLLAPSLNPDGLDHVASWYEETEGTPFEASGLLKLYQYYAGHDNNRDWFMLTQQETRIVTELLYTTWHPQVYWDVHQQGSRRERFFLPPFRDPLNPNLDPAIVAGIDLLGTRGLLDLTRAGFSGVSTGVSYDMWWNGGNRNVPVRHNIIGLLTEAASARLASPVFLPQTDLSPPSGIDGDYGPSNRFPDPWPGGWWRIGDIIRYEHGFARSLLASLAREPEYWLSNALEAARRAIDELGEEAPLAWILPAGNRDPAAVARLVDVLLRTGVELSVAEEELVADGRTWPAGSLVVLRKQPYGSHVKDLFEVQRYPAGDSPYDVAGWTLPFLLGVHRVEAMEVPRGATRRVSALDDALAGFGGDPRAADPGVRSLHDSATWSDAFARLSAGERVSFVLDGDGAGLVHEGAREDAVVLEGVPRVGLYSPWSGSMDEGWMRWVFDAYGVPYVTVRNEMLRAGDLERFLDVLVIPGISAGELDRGRAPGSVPPEYTRGLDPEGAVAVEVFVRAGGVLVTLGGSSQWAIDLFELPLVDVTSGEQAAGFSCPGSVLRGIPETDPYTTGLPASLALFFSRSAAWREMTEEEREQAGLSERATKTLLRYAPTRVLMSGWIAAPETIEGRAAWIVAPHGRGRAHLFAFRPQYRGWSQATFSLVFRAILLGGSPE